ncbi:MAG: hypothetical protein V1817_02330 [Candidatus Micrarchaeota archaeon]
MAGRGLYGVFITKSTSPHRNNQKRVAYNFYGGKLDENSRDYRKKGELFVTSKAINKAFAEKVLAEIIEEKKRLHIGYIEYVISPATKKLCMWNYYPLSKRKTLGKIGLASLVELQALKDLLKEHGNYTYVSIFNNEARERQNQLRKQERTKTMALKETIQRLQDYVVRKSKETPQNNSVKRGSGV